MLHMVPIGVGGYNISVLSVRESACQLATNSIGFFRRYLARHKGLAQVIRDHIVFSSASPCPRNIFALHEQKLSVRCFGIAPKARHQFSLMRLFRIGHIPNYVADCFTEISSFARMQRDKARGCHADFISLFSKKFGAKPTQLRAIFAFIPSSNPASARIPHTALQAASAQSAAILPD